MEAERTEAYGFGASLQAPIGEVVERVTTALKEEGFGVLTTIDVRETMRQKLGVEFEPYYILGACNPHLAHRALSQVHDIGLLLPCNVIVHAHGDDTRVDIADPIAMLKIVGEQAEVMEVAREARGRLRRVIEKLAVE